MVEILDSAGDREKLLSRRVEALGAELDRLEKTHKQTTSLLSKTVKLLTGLCGANPGSSLAGALEELSDSAGLKPFSLKMVTSKLDQVQSALLSAEPGGEVQRISPSPERGSPDPAGDLEHQEALLCAISALAKLAPADPELALAQAVSDLQAAVKARPFLPEPVLETCEAVKKELILHQEDPETMEPDAENGDLGGPQEDPRTMAGWKLAERLLKGMRMGDEAFDAELEKSIGAIEEFTGSGKLDRPALGMAADLMEQFRSLLYKRHQDAHGALMDILNELMKTESALVRTVEHAGNRLLDSNQEARTELDQGLGILATDISQSRELRTLQRRALDQVQELKDQLMTRLNWQAQMMGETLQRTGELRQALQDAEIRISMAEDKSRRWGRAALTDSLTGAWNQKALELMLSRSVGDPASVFSLILFDVDGFKRLVESWGSQAADKALNTIAAHVTDCLREEDYLFRHAADLFAAMVRGAEPKMAAQVAERIRDRISTIKFSYQGYQPMRLTVTLVVAQPNPEESADEFWGRAERALYQAKQKGRTARVHEVR